MQSDYVTARYTLWLLFAVCLTAIRYCSTKLQPSSMAMEADRRSLALGNILSLLEAKFTDAEMEYQHAGANTEQNRTRFKYRCNSVSNHGVIHAREC